MCSPTDIRDNAAIGSPWDPVVIITNWSGLYIPILSISIIVPSGAFKYPNSWDTAKTFTILRPTTATFLLNFTAELIICCILCTFDANVATIILFVQLVNNLSNSLPTLLSDIVWPGLWTLVLSDNNKVTPSLPSSAILCKSIYPPSIGV